MTLWGGESVNAEYAQVFATQIRYSMSQGAEHIHMQFIHLLLPCGTWSIVLLVQYFSPIYVRIGPNNGGT